MKGSKLETKFALYWHACGGPGLISEYRFHSTRKWRFDWYHEPTRTAYEIQGGHWTGGRHTTGAGFEKDCEKFNEAQMMGFKVYCLTSNMITTAYLTRLIHNLGTFQQPARHTP